LNELNKLKMNSMNSLMMSKRKFKTKIGRLIKVEVTKLISLKKSTASRLPMEKNRKLKMLRIYLRLDR
jgi:hypothetical protein